MKKSDVKFAFGGGGNCGVERDIVRGAGEAAKFLKDDRTIRRKDDKSETEAICRHSKGNNNFIPKNLLLNNQEIDNSCNSRHSERLAKNLLNIL